MGEPDDLWKIAADVITVEQSAPARETFTLFVGQRQSGKSSLITAFHNPTKDEGPKPTVALEYLFARRSAASSNQVRRRSMWYDLPATHSFFA
jgi:hypothetical protein